MMDFVTLRIYKGRLELLLLRRNMKDRPHYGEYALVGGMVYFEDKTGGLKRDETYQGVRDRIINSKLGVVPSIVREVFNDGGAKRDASGWSVVAVHYAFIEPSISESVEKMEGYKWVDINDVMLNEVVLPFDHSDAVRRVLTHIRYMLGYSSIILYLLPCKFTIADIVKAYSLFGIVVSRQIVRGRLINGGHIKQFDGGYEVKQGKPTPYYTVSESEMSFFDRVVGCYTKKWV